jgi:hypothetical protein
LQNVSELKGFVESSEMVVFFLTRGYFKSYWCVEEMQSAEGRDQPTTLVLETDPRHGGLTMLELQEEILGKGVPDAVREQIMSGELTQTLGVIPWYRAAPYMAVTLKRLVQRLLYIAMPADGLRAGALYLRNEVGLHQPKLLAIDNGQWHMFLISSPNAHRVRAALRRHVPALRVCVGQDNRDTDVQEMRKSKVVVIFGEDGALSSPGVQSMLDHALLKLKPTVVINPGVVFAKLMDECPVKLHAYLFQVMCKPQPRPNPNPFTPALTLTLNHHSRPSPLSGMPTTALREVTYKSGRSCLLSGS